MSMTSLCRGVAPERAEEAARYRVVFVRESPLEVLRPARMKTVINSLA